MYAWTLHQPQRAEQNPLQKMDIPVPSCGKRDLKVNISACGVCHTDLHIVEGELDLPVLPLVPGHQIVGLVAEVGEQVRRFSLGDRVGIAWLNQTCGACEYCQRERENLCPEAQFTGYHVNGGFAEAIVIDERYVYAIPDNYDDFQAAPLLCAGIVGFRALRVAGVQPGERVGLYGFGASAHLAIQVLTHWNCETYVFSRGSHHRKLAQKLGAVWTGQAGNRPPKPLHRAIIYAPAGWIMVEALKDVAPGGVVTSGGIHMSPIPQFPYSLLWEERCLNSVAHATRTDGEDFMAIAAARTMITEVEIFPCDEINQVLVLLKESKLKAAAVLKVKA
ncbi:zinc-dependent alcohol dehydrogenase family protein [candidate division CSSED10-310 bacterium]|uniref:Zinc-dependent alcohol dehydrogenase family protein n=1 Tax=candidate division CSSED10-310 bacterium TaxID=2855610 RepID=A0ABV6YTU3_UNCC1